MEQKTREKLQVLIVKYLSLGVILNLFVFCHSESKTEWPQTVVLKGITNPIKLHSEVIEESLKFYNAKNFFMYKDSVMVVLNKANKKNHFVVFQNIKTGETIAEFIKLGRANNEMLNCTAHIRGNTLYVEDFVKNNIAFINIDSVITYGNKYKIGKFVNFGNNIGSGFVTQYDSKRLIMLNPYCFYDKKMGINNKQPRFVVSVNYATPPLQTNDELYYTFNVTQGSIIPNMLKNRVIYASSSLSEIEIYDFNLNPIKKYLDQ